MTPFQIRLAKSWLVFAVLVFATSPIRAEDKPKECEPQPTCEFDNLVIKPGAQTPGINRRTGQPHP